MNAIKVLREKAGLTQQQLGELLGVRQSTVAMWETAGCHPRASKLPLLAKALQCNIDELYRENKEPQVD